MGTATVLDGQNGIEDSKVESLEGEQGQHTAGRIGFAGESQDSKTPYYADERVRVYGGDCLEVMPQLEAESFDAIVTDPPYHLTSIVKRFGKDGAAPAQGGSDGRYARLSKGFMGKEWDGGDVAFRPETWAAAYRVAKPGAHLVAMGGTRTYHRLVCAIEDAGWEVRDTAAWIFGCLSEDTEILIDGQWEPYHKATAGRHALCYNVADDTYSWQPIQDQFIYGYSDTAYRIRSDHTDQIVSRNHRCLVERGGSYVFQVAEEAARERQARVPVLEDLPALLNALPLPHQGAGNAQQDVFDRVREGDAYWPEASGAGGAPGDGAVDVCVREGVLARKGSRPAGERAPLLAPLQWDGPRQGVGYARPQGKQGARPRELREGGDARGQEPGLEGRRHLLPQTRQLQAHQVRAVPGGVPGDGADGWLRDGASAPGGARYREAVAAAGGGASRQPRPAGQSARQPDAICVEPRPQTVRASRFTRTDLAVIEPVFYQGIVWCVRVPTGAFVARRNGKVFVTGNSGFPKSLNVSAQIDKMAGVEREVVGDNPNHRPVSGVQYEGIYRGGNTGGPNITAPATDAARQWAGFGSALKPAMELICIARKPLSEKNVAANVLQHGTGAINVDGCRIEGGAGWTARAGSDFAGDGGWKDVARESNPAGRWPANVLLDTCDEHDGTGQCCASAMLDEQSGVSVSGKPRDDRGRGGIWSPSTGIPAGPQHGDSGGASRYFARFHYDAKASRTERQGVTHPTVKPVSLMRWLARLVCPPGGHILDCFAGSGTTRLAALAEGFRVTLIEREAAYLEQLCGRTAAMGLPLEGVA